MLSRRSLLFVCLMLVAVPLAAHERNVILVLVDLETNRAYIPEGTVLPPGMNVRMERTTLDKATFEGMREGRDREERGVRESRRPDRASTARLKARPPLVFEYAPSDRFAEVRKGYEARAAKQERRVRSNTGMTCFDTYVQYEQQGYYGGYYNGFLSTFCQQSSGIVVGQPNDWSFTSTGDYSDVDQTISPRVWVEDNNGNFNCYDYFSGGGDPGQCTASDTTVLWQVGCLNVVDTASVQYVIEYLPGYVENYIGYTFLVDYCTYFY